MKTILKLAIALSLYCSINVRAMQEDSASVHAMQKHIKQLEKQKFGLINHNNLLQKEIDINTRISQLVTKKSEVKVVFENNGLNEVILRSAPFTRESAEIHYMFLTENGEQKTIAVKPGKNVILHRIPYEFWFTIDG